MGTDTLKVNIAVSRKNDGSDITDELIKKTNGVDEQPKALFLFSTIHYQKKRWISKVTSMHV